MTDNGPRPVDWRLPAIWAALLAVSVVVRTYVAVADQARTSSPISYGDAAAIEISSHLVIAALLPVLYWLHRRWPLSSSARPLLIHAAAVVPFSIAHTVGMAALRLVWFSAILGKAYSFPLTSERLAYEFAKDIVSYIMLSAGIVALHHILQRFPAAAPAVVVEPSVDLSIGPSAERPERFAVRKRGKEIMVEVADIDWVEAAGNYAVLHVGGDTLEIRSSLTKLEGELDPRRFVRVHKSYVVNVARIAEVTPWISGDWRIRLQDGAEVNLSRRYRQRFEALVPVRS